MMRFRLRLQGLDIKCLFSRAELSGTFKRRIQRGNSYSLVAGTSNMDSERELRLELAKAKKVVVLTGAGISAESGIPTFRGAGGLWRTWDAMELATPGAFAADPSLVWEFYHYRRTVVQTSRPNAGHHAIAGLERWCREQQVEQSPKEFVLLTQEF
eukprot:TRINITY_DN13965_c0_g1_i1.p2 TRINITY_DN13965_c0_g1~~TRINITY_DN13965_c0_g1_i1.p2  ORF type:complete len:156 (+),score=13.21 TRINITY_DN13965_c0_g1_i1:224-691(+)